MSATPGRDGVVLLSHSAGPATVRFLRPPSQLLARVRGRSRRLDEISGSEAYRRYSAIRLGGFAHSLLLNVSEDPRLLLRGPVSSVRAPERVRSLLLHTNLCLPLR